MADYETRTVTKVTKEYILRSPTNWTEIGKLFAALDRDVPGEMKKWDDSVTVEARGDEIVFSYTVSETQGSGL